MIVLATKLAATISDNFGSDFVSVRLIGIYKWGCQDLGQIQNGRIHSPNLQYEAVGRTANVSQLHE